MNHRMTLFCLFCLCISACKQKETIKPDVITEKLVHDSDDPAIWYNAANPEKSLILGTDKEVGGGLYVFDLNGKELKDKSIKNIDYPNNVDVGYGLKWNDSTAIDIAIVTERAKQRIRIFSIPDMKAVDGGGIPVFEGEQGKRQWPMGVALYKKQDTMYAFVSRKEGPTDGSYIWQYKLSIINDTVKAEVVRKFGGFSGGTSEIEAIMVDQDLGYIYYSDEAYGIRKYHADPAKGNEEVTSFGKSDFKEDKEGISLWPKENGNGYIVISNQQAHNFNVYDRNPANHGHKLVGQLPLSTIETDGCELSTKNFGPKFPKGLFVAMSEGGIFHYYDLRKLVVE